METRYCIFDYQKQCLNNRVKTKTRTFCCLEIEKIEKETFREAALSLTDIIQDYEKTNNYHVLFTKAMQILSFLSNVCECETTNQKEIMVTVYAMVNLLRRSDTNVRDIIYSDFFKFVKLVKIWIKSEFLKEKIVEMNFLHELLELSQKIQIQLSPGDDPEDIFL